MTTLINQLPPELLNIIETYKKPMKCDHCKKISFEILFCIRNDNHYICHDCIDKCSLCNVFVYNTNKINEYSGCNDSYGCFVGSSKYIKMINTEQYYCPGHDCNLCGKMVCYKCFIIADDYCGQYYCKQCISKCPDCDEEITNLKNKYFSNDKYCCCEKCDKCIIHYEWKNVNKYYRRL